MSTKTEIFDSFAVCNTGNQLLEKIDSIISELDTFKFQVMSPEQEVSYIVDDVFDGDINLQNSCIESLCVTHGVAFSEENQDAINDLIIEHEDELYSMVLGQEQLTAA